MNHLRHLWIPLVMLLTASCATMPARETVMQHVSPQSDPGRFAGNYRNLRVGFDRSSEVIKPDDSLFHILAQRYFVRLGLNLDPNPSRQAITSIRHIEDTRFSVSLIEGDRAVETISLELRPADGYLVSGSKSRFYPLILINGYQNEVFAIGLDADNDLHAFRGFLGAGGFLFFMSGNRSESHSVFQRLAADATARR